MTAEHTRPDTAAAPEDVIVIAERAMSGVESAGHAIPPEATQEALFAVLAAMSARVAFGHQHNSERAELVASVRRRQHAFEIGQ